MFFSAENIVVYYERIKALDNVSITLDEGQIIALIGANGAGKTTTLRAIAGLTPLYSGRVSFNNKRIDGLPPQKIVQNGIALAPEGRHIFPQMTVKDNLLMGAYLNKDKAAVAEDLEQVCTHFPILRERSNQAGGKLSGGEQQMLAMARALMARPKLLLLDEPSLGLSPMMVAEIGRAITDINKKRHVSIILVEQNSRLALKIAHRGYVLEVGKVALEDTTEDLLKNEMVKKIYLGE